MNKKMLFLAIIFLLPVLANADDKKILKIGNNMVTEADVRLKETLINNLFKRKYHRPPTDNDQKKLAAIRLDYQKLKIFEVVNKLIMKEIKTRYYHKIVTQEVIAEYIEKNKANIAEEIKRYMMFLAAADYVKKSKGENKYRIAYEKYKNLGLVNTYSFFKSAVDNEKYLAFLESRIQELSKNGISETAKEMIFSQELSNYIVNELTEEDQEIKEHLQLAQKHGCNYKEFLFAKWFIDQGNKMGVKIFDSRYGRSLKDILNPHQLDTILHEYR